MKYWTEEKLRESGYTIENVKINSVELSMADHCQLTLRMWIEGEKWSSVVGGFSIGRGYLGGKKFSGCLPGIDCLMQIMNIVGVAEFSELAGKYIRVAAKEGSYRNIFGNFIKDIWFDVEQQFITCNNH